MLTKKQILQTLSDLPDQFMIEDLFERLIFIQKIEKGIDQSKANLVVSTAEAKEHLKKWLK